jgi:hypothetical protein
MGWISVWRFSSQAGLKGIGPFDRAINFAPAFRHDVADSMAAFQDFGSGSD